MSEEAATPTPGVDGVGSPDVGSWWAALAGTALLGTARAAVPPWPEVGVRPRPAAGREEALLDAVAVAGALVLAGRPVAAGTGAAAVGAAPCGPDRCPPAPDGAEQLLRLALVQPPVGRELHDTVVVRWLQAAHGAGRAVPHELLPALLTAASTRPALREPLRAVLDERGRWLAARRADWTWALGVASTTVLDDEWTRAATGDRPAVLRRIRAADPARGRALVAQALAGASAKERAALVEALVVGLGPDDEDVLVTALADRAKAVGQAATPLLDALPTSARGARLGAALAASVSVHGRLSPRIEVAALPPLEGDVRTDDAPDVGSAGWLPWALEQAVAGAPLEVLAQAAGNGPAAVLRLDKDGLLRPGVRRAVLARRDVEWARALLTTGWDADVAAVLPRDEHEAVVAAQLGRAAGMAAAALVSGVPRPWGEAFGCAVVDWCARAIGPADRPVALALDAGTLGSGLGEAAAEPVRRAVEAAQAAEAAAARAVARHGPAAPGPGGASPQASPAAREAAAALSTARHNVRVLRDVAQLLSFTRSIDEAFS